MRVAILAAPLFVALLAGCSSPPDVSGQECTVGLFVVGVNEDGALVCSAPPEGGAVDWADLTGIPGGFSDNVDGDALGLLACTTGQFVRWSGSGWECASPPTSSGHGHAVTVLRYDDSFSDATPGSAFELLGVLGTFDKEDVESIIILHWTGDAAKTGSDPLEHCAFQLRIDGRDDAGTSSTAVGAGATAWQYADDDSHGVTGYFDWPGAGEHDVEVWVRGTADGCAVNPAGFDQTVVVEEIG